MKQKLISPSISGLKLITNFISLEEEKKLIETINEQIWNKSLKNTKIEFGGSFHRGYNIKSK